MKKPLLLFALTYILSGCVSQSTHTQLENVCDSLKTENARLLAEIEELKTGEDRLINLIKNSYAGEKYIATQAYIEILKVKHPASSFIREIEKTYSDLKNKVIIETEKIETARKDSIRLANINNLGIWEVGNYVDEYGEPTTNSYVSTDLYGTFSNSATTNSELRVRFLIDENSMRIQLYEYAKNHPIKGEGFLKFKAKDSKGKDCIFETYNNDSGDNTVETKSFKQVKELLISGGQIKFIAIANRFGSPSEYKFTIDNADFLENALYKMELTKK